MSRKFAKDWLKKTAGTLSLTALLTGGSLQADSLFCFDSCNLPKMDVYADFLYWQFCPEGTEYARAGYLGGFTFAPLALQQGQVYKPVTHFYSGFRVGAMAHFNCCELDAFIQYTWQHPILSDRAAFPLAIGSVPISTLQPQIASRTPGSPFETLSSASAKWSTTFNVFDAGFGRSFEVNGCFLFRPHFGLKGSWQDVKFDVTYFRSAGTTFTNRIQCETDLWAVGPRGGFELNWRFSPSFSLVANTALSAMYAHFDTRRDDYLAQSNLASELRLGHQTEEQCALLPVLELFFGFRYELCSTFVMLGWEEQIWFNFNRSILETADFQGPHGNLVIQGVTLRGGVGF